MDSVEIHTLSKNQLDENTKPEKSNVLGNATPELN
jgi:hypothetical protein